MPEPDPARPAGPRYELSVVIACYQEEGHLEESVRELRATLDGMGRSYELIFIEDCSRDRTAEIIQSLVADQSHWRAVYHEQNQGRGATVREGFQLAQGRVVGFLDIDLEVHCNYLPGVLQAIDEGADGATAYREYHPSWHPSSLLRHVLSGGYRRLFRFIFKVPFRDPETGFKFFVTEKILPVVRRTKDGAWFWDSEIMILAHYAGLQIREIPCEFVRRMDKKSTVRIFADVLAYLRAIRAFKRRLREDPELARPAPAE